ncbi:MAG: ATPase, T2SS/T4P/T4SS family, partial [Oscillospiraceae bacterium]
VGICGEAVYDGETLRTIDNVSSLNIRIAREKNGLAKKLFEKMPLDSVGGFIIAGSPKSGKTTLLRDIARYISSGETAVFQKVCVIDERCEIASMYSGEPQNDIGICCDILSGYKKSDGINMAIRTMSPDYIICDEIALDSEIEAVFKGVNSGAKIITTVHAKDMGELEKKPFIKKLIGTNAFDAVAFLSTERRGEVENIAGLNALLKGTSSEK